MAAFQDTGKMHIGKRHPTNTEKGCLCLSIIEYRSGSDGSQFGAQPKLHPQPMVIDDRSVRWTFCGASAGLAVDLGLYPLDTIKTRLQSKEGFRASGGFKNIYSGLGSVAIGSAPGAAFFFLTYGSVKKLIGGDNAVVHGFAATIGEVVACLVRVPTELIKQRSQATKMSSLTSIGREIYSSHGFFGFYRGYLSTVAREIPFSIIQYPLWEYLKKQVASKNGSKECGPLAGAACGSVAGAFAAAFSTPLDVAKTRIMLSRDQKAPSILQTLTTVFEKGGIRALYSGVTPRVIWMSLGGFVYFGAYESILSLTYWIHPSKTCEHL